MATHSISVHPSRPLEVVNADLVIEVRSDDDKLGELRLSKGSIDWVPSHHQTAISLPWEQFDRIMREVG